MASVRDICRCSHVRNSHADRAGACKNATCSCGKWSPAYPVYDDALPVGVTPIFDTRDGLTLVQCVHAEELRGDWPAGPYCRFCFGEPRTTDGFRLPVKRLVVAPPELRLL
jgi:hypothetical protein